MKDQDVQLFSMTWRQHDVYYQLNKMFISTVNLLLTLTHVIEYKIELHYTAYQQYINV